MKRILTCIVIVIVVFAVGYGLGVFIAWNINPENWHEMGRLMIAFAALVVSCAAILSVEDTDLL